MTMGNLLHRIKIFVYRLGEPGPDYLLLKSAQGIESLWGPLHGDLGFGEKLEGAIRRRVMEDTGLAPPAQLVDLEMPSRWLLGDEEIVEWTFGFQANAAPDTRRLARAWAAHRWACFEEAYPTLGLDPDRAAIMRLHTHLNAA
ncbi:MAG: NUDIX domain-containing protein [Planctomycetota bacterium]